MTKDGRDIRIDIIRGYAMLTIAVYHFNFMFYANGYRGQMLPQLGSYGFSTAAEIFFILSGYMVGYIYLRRPGVLVKSLQRAWTIYGINILVFICAIAIAWQSGDQLIRFSGAYRTLDDPLPGTLRFLLFQQYPYLLEVLQTYVMFLLATPIMAGILGRSRWLFLALTIGVYLYVQLPDHAATALGESGPTASRWSFHPLAWQLPYCLGMLSGRTKFHIRLFDWIGERIWRPIGFIVLFAAAVVLHRLHILNLITVPAWDKSTLGIVRLLHACLVLGLLASMLSFVKRYVDLLPFRIVATLGSHTLHCFAASVVLTYAMLAFWLNLGTPPYAYWMLLGGLMVSLVAVAYLREIDLSLMKSFRRPFQSSRVRT